MQRARHRAIQAGVVSAAALLAAAGLVGAAARDAGPGVGPWVDADEATIRLVSRAATVAPGETTLWLGVHMRLSDGWKIYWRTPGASGLPPQLDWAGSTNLAGAVVHWPAPRRFESFGQQGYGYGGEVLLPVAASLARAGERAAFRLAVSYLICREVCIPGEAALALDVAAGDGALSAAAGELDRHRARVPVKAETLGLGFSAVAEPGGISVVARGGHRFSDPDLFLEWPTAPGQRRPDLPKPAVTLGQDGHEVRFSVTLHPPLARPGTTLRATVTDGAFAAEGEITVAASPR